MKTSLLSRGGFLAAVALLIVGAMGCGHPPHAGFGDVDIIATVPSDVLVHTLAFEIVGADAKLASGQIRTRRPQTQFEQLVTHVPVGDDERLDLSATSTDGGATCSGSVPLEVRKGVTTRVHVALQCRGKNDGVIHVVIGVSCPQTHLVSYAVSPLSASVGGAIDVIAVDEGADAGALRYTWAATAGTFADPAAARTTYRCTAPGRVTISLLVVSDVCRETYTTEVTCSAVGDAGVD